MKQVIAYLCMGIAVVSGGLCAGALVVMGLGIRDETETWFWALFVALALFIICAATLAIGFTAHEPRHRMPPLKHPIAVGRSGAPEMTDPMPSPARVRRPVSEAYRAQERTLSERE